MVWWLWSIVGILILVIAALSLKIYVLKKSAKEIGDAIADKLETESNTLIDISSHDKHMRQLAAGLNKQLRKLRKARHRFQEGDADLKNAVMNISHDLRTPLTAICGYLDLLESERQPEETARYLLQIKNRTEAMRQLLEELFQYSMVTSVQELQMEPVNLRKLLEECLLSFESSMQQKKMEPNIELPNHSVEKILDLAAVTRIFNNIISNALKYSDGDLGVTMNEEGTMVFSNTARALTPVLVERLFDRFYTVESARRSTGLGLSIAKQLTENMGGRIWAEYRKGKLYITLSFQDH